MKTYTIRHLEWVDSDDYDQRPGDTMAITLFGKYYIRHRGDIYPWSLRRGVGERVVNGHTSTMEESKVACQEHFEWCMSQGLDEVHP